MKSNFYVCHPFRKIHRGVEQLVARRAHNPEVGGSSPPPATLTLRTSPSGGVLLVCPEVPTVTVLLLRAHELGYATGRFALSLR